MPNKTDCFHVQYCLFVISCTFKETLRLDLSQSTTFTWSSFVKDLLLGKTLFHLLEMLKLIVTNNGHIENSFNDQPSRTSALLYVKINIYLKFKIFQFCVLLICCYLSDTFIINMMRFVFLLIRAPCGYNPLMIYFVQKKIDKLFRFF